jgi:adenylate kinase family enzyme
LSAHLSEILKVPVISLDKLYWKPDWVETPDEEFRNSVRDGMNRHSRGWIIDGHYSRILGAQVSEEATDIICLYLSFPS